MRSDPRRAGAAALAAVLVASWGLGCAKLNYPDEGVGPGHDETHAGPQSHVATAHDARAWVRHSAEGREQMRIRDYSAAEQSYLAALAETGAFPVHDARVRTALGNLIRLAAARQAQSEWDDADRLIERVVLNADNGRLADFGSAAPVMARQAMYRARRGNPDGAIELYETSLTLYGVTDPSQIATRLDIESLLGNTYLSIGRFDDAERLLQSVLRGVRSLAGPESLAASLAQIDVARLDDATGDFDGAESGYRAALAIQQKQVPGSLELAKTQSKIAWFYLEHGRNEEAAQHAAAAVASFDDRNVTGAPLIAVLDTLATAEARLGRNDLAEADYSRALALYDESDAQTRTSLVELLDHFAEFERSRGRGPNAESLSDRANRERAATVAGAAPAE